jgi:hypothetical protein
MDNASASNDDVTQVYIRLVRKESQDAAAVLEQIQTRFGAPAALRAALIITLLKQEIHHFHDLPSIEKYTHLLKDYTEAIPLLNEAIHFCIDTWNVSESAKSESLRWQQPVNTPSDGARAPFQDLIEQIRQHSPITAMKLEQIYKNYGITAGGYAATTLVWIEASLNKFGDSFLKDFTERQMNQLSYTEFMQTDKEAIHQFIDLLECYRAER